MKPIILGSQSPRRKEILSYFTLPYTVAVHTFDEESLPFDGNLTGYACNLAAQKANSLKDLYPDHIIIAADSLVFHDGKIYGKPKDEEEAVRFLQELSGNWHTVCTGVAVTDGEQLFAKSEETQVLFNKITEDHIRQYHKNSHWHDRAGGYGIQMGGGLLVNRIEGCYYNVMGLPVNTLSNLLQKVGIELWDYIN